MGYVILGSSSVASLSGKFVWEVEQEEREGEEEAPKISINYVRCLTTATTTKLKCIGSSNTVVTQQLTPLVSYSILILSAQQHSFQEFAIQPMSEKNKLKKK